MRVDPNPALAELQRLRPAKLRVYVRDSDEPKAVAIPANRKKWERLGTTLEGLDWVRIEALDSRGNITGVVAREDDSPEAAVGDTVEITEAEALAPMLSLMLRAQQMALQQQSVLIKPLIDGMAKLVQVQTDALGAVAGAYRMALAAASTAPTGGGEKGEGEGDQALFRFLQVAMMMASKNGGPAAALGAVQTATASVKSAKPASATSTARPAPPPSTAAAPGPRAQ